MNLAEHVAAATEWIEVRHRAREQAITSARALVRQCANSIRAAHRSDFEEAQKLLDKAAEIVHELRDAVANYPDLLFSGYTQDALKEYAEASLVYAFLRDEPPPSADDLQVEPAAYLNGLAEAASELRRAILDGLRHGQVERGKRLLSLMDDAYSLLITVDYPEAITGGLRRTTDALRAVLERTRGDMVTAMRQEQLMQAITSLESSLQKENSLQK